MPYKVYTAVMITGFIVIYCWGIMNNLAITIAYTLIFGGMAAHTAYYGDYIADNHAAHAGEPAEEDQQAHAADAGLADHAGEPAEEDQAGFPQWRDNAGHGHEAFAQQCFGN